MHSDLALRWPSYGIQDKPPSSSPIYAILWDHSKDMTETRGAATGMIGPDETVKYGSTGCPTSNMEANIVDPASGEALPPGQHGELWLRGLMVSPYNKIQPLAFISAIPKSLVNVLAIQQRYQDATGYLPFVFEGSSSGAGKIGTCGDHSCSYLHLLDDLDLFLALTKSLSHSSLGGDMDKSLRVFGIRCSRPGQTGG
ncbi:hypothetical protein LguiB_001699 [Lonicera macranthoides]